jgi:hypothetical protein
MATIDLTYPKLLDLFREHLDPNRTESASFLIWYLENYLRLDPIEAVDAVCDQPGDKGVDGIYINEDSGTIEVYQSKIFQKKGRTIGDTLLKEFAGTLKQFESTGTLKSMVASAGKADVARLVERLDLINKVGDYAVKGVFISNSDLDHNGNRLSQIPQFNSLRRQYRAHIHIHFCREGCPYYQTGHLRHQRLRSVHICCGQRSQSSHCAAESERPREARWDCQPSAIRL